MLKIAIEHVDNRPGVSCSVVRKARTAHPPGGEGFSYTVRGSTTAGGTDRPTFLPLFEPLRLRDARDLSGNEEVS